MSNGYDQFFRQARKAATEPGEAKPKAKKPTVKPTFKLEDGPRFDLKKRETEALLRKSAGIRPKKKSRPFPWAVTIVSAMGMLLTGWAMLNAEDVEKTLKRVEVNWMGEASANEAAPKPAAAAAAAKAAVAEASSNREPSAVELDHLSKLNDRKKELDAREQELGRQETELATMKSEVDRRLKELDEMRSKISEMLQDKVKTDDSKVETLVQMYSNMKPPQAAKIFETLDEDLAVEILGRMKKKNAADIMNLLKPEKAQVFSEKYAGYKRK